MNKTYFIITICAVTCILSGCSGLNINSSVRQGEYTDTPIIATEKAVKTEVSTETKKPLPEGFDVNDASTWFDKEGKTVVSLGKTEQLAIGMSFEDVVREIGRPQRDPYSGIIGYEWELEDGRMMHCIFSRESDGSTQALSEIRFFEAEDLGIATEVTVP